jgi:hypothetical protein
MNDVFALIVSSLHRISHGGKIKNVPYGYVPNAIIMMTAQS